MSGIWRRNFRDEIACVVVTDLVALAAMAIRFMRYNLELRQSGLESPGMMIIHVQLILLANLT